MNKTPNYHLPLWESGDITSWLTQLNKAMCQIDCALHGLALRTQPIGDQPETVVSDIEKLNKEVAEATANITNISKQLTEAQTNIGSLQTQQATTTINVNTLLTNTANLDTRVTAIEAALVTINATITKLQTEQQTQADSLSALDSRVSALEESTT